MDPGLKEFALQVWQNQGSIKDYNKVYDLYNDFKNPRQKLGLPKKWENLLYLKHLQGIAQKRKNTAPQQKSPWMQAPQDFHLDEGVRFLEDHLLGRLDLGKFQDSGLVKSLVASKCYGPLTKDQFSAAHLEDVMFTDFYHFIGKEWAETRRACVWRIYLNVKADYATEAMKHVVDTIVDGMTGISEAKIGGPQAIESRSDVIVIYLNYLKPVQGPDPLGTSKSRNQNPMQAVFNVLEDNIKPWLKVNGNQSKLNDTSPAMTERIWPGVSVGAEPSDEQVSVGQALRQGKKEGPSGGYSFGSLRAQAIYKALKEYEKLPVARQNTQDAFVAFLGKVEEQFKLHHINPDLPFT